MGVHPRCPVCLLVAASLVAVETDVGGTFSVPKVAFVCGLWSVGAVALLSAGLSSYFCIHQLLFPCLEVLVQSASPNHAGGCKVLAGLGVDVKCFHVSLADILVAQLLAAFGSSDLHKLTATDSKTGVISRGYAEIMSSASNLLGPPHWPSGKASASTAVNLGSIPAFAMDLSPGQVIPVT